MLLAWKKKSVSRVPDVTVTGAVLAVSPIEDQ